MKTDEGFIATLQGVQAHWWVDRITNRSIPLGELLVAFFFWQFCTQTSMAMADCSAARAARFTSSELKRKGME
jgi:hypothetical protein